MTKRRRGSSRSGPTETEGGATVTVRQALSFLEQRGVLLESGRGVVPSLAEWVAGEPIRGNWWGHEKGHLIFRLTRAIRESPDVLTCRLVDQKVTYVHRRLWPALVRLASQLDKGDLAAIREEHTRSGAHRISEEPFPRWVPADVQEAARKLSEEEARAQVDACFALQSKRARSIPARE